MRRGGVLLLLAAALAGCGSTTAAKPRSCPGHARALAKIQRDIAAIRRAARLPVKDTLVGNAAINRALDRFQLDLATAPLSNLERNRLTDHAAAALLGACQQCFQALEANRPIPAISHAGAGRGCARG